MPYLFRLFNADAPLAATSRHALSGIDEIELGRSERPSARRQGRALILGVADPRMSERHARLALLAGRWVLEDLGSKNGTRVDGVSTPRAVLAGHERIECGRTLWVLRFAAADPEAPLDLQAAERSALPGLETVVPAFARELSVLRRVARSNTTLVLVGESGVGKELAARAAHALSGRKSALVALNCGALPPGLIEATLFGHTKGAFSGATEDRPGLFRAADGGTLLLDELGELSPPAQAALLRCLQEREVLPIGGTRPLSVDVRVMVAAQSSLESMVAQGRLRPDLMARLSGCTIALPPLRERMEDLGTIIAELLRRASPSPERVRFAPAAARALFDHPWPLNVRELEKCLERALALAGGARIELEHLPPALRAARAEPRPEEEGGHRRELEGLLTEHRGNVSAVARAVGKDRVQVRRWLARYGLDPARYRPPG